MQVIKNIGLVFILLFSLLVSGCGQSEQTTSQPQHSSVSQAESNSVSSQRVETPPIVDINDNIQYTFVNLGAFSTLENNIQNSMKTEYHPVSYTVGGNQFRRTDVEKEWGTDGYYPDVDYKAYERADAIYLYSRDYYDTRSTGYANLEDEVAAVTNGDWNVFSANVKYINYRVDTDRQPQQKWIDFFSSEMKDILGVDVPVMIYHAWMFEYNGMECAIVEADNINTLQGFNGQEISTSLPAGEENYAYRITGIFIGDRHPIVDSYDEFYIHKKPLSNKSKSDYIGCSFVAPTGTSINDEDFGDYGFDTYQYNQNGDIEQYSIYYNWFFGDNPVNIIQCKPFFFIGDVDGDGIVEIVRENNYVSSLGHHIQVYDITEDGVERR